MQLEAIRVQQAPNKGVQRKSKPTGEEGLEAYPLIWCRGRDRLIPRQARFTLHHHAVGNQRSQICGIHRRLFPTSRHLGRLRSGMCALGHRFRRRIKEKKEGRLKNKKRAEERRWQWLGKNLILPTHKL